MRLAGREVSQRRVFVTIAVLLGLALVALLIYLLFFMGDTAEPVEPREVAGILPILSIEGPETGERPEFDRPLGAAFGPDGRIYVADTGNHRVCVFAADGAFLFEFGGHGVVKPAPQVEPTWQPGLMNSPVAVDVSSDGTVHVADFYNNQIQAFDAEGVFLRSFPDPLQRVGQGGSGQGGTGIAVTDVHAAGGRVYATDRYQVVVFEEDGTFVTQFGKPGVGSGDLDHPNGLFMTDEGTLYVADSNNNRVVAFDGDGQVRWAFGAFVSQLDKQEENPFGLPRDVTVTERGTLLVVDAFEFELVEVDTEGEVLGRYGRRGVAPGEFNFPNSIDTYGDLLLVADKENDRVQVLRLVRR